MRSRPGKVNVGSTVLNGKEQKSSADFADYAEFGLKIGEICLYRATGTRAQSADKSRQKRKSLKVLTGDKR
jgi:hypothetical protein